MKSTLFNIFAAVTAMAAAMCACACSSDEPQVTRSSDRYPDDEPPAMATRTVLVYMVADNTLGKNWGCDELDIQEMIEGVQAGGGLNGGRLIVYHNKPRTDKGNPPQLKEITAQGERVLKTYPDDASVYSVDPERIRQVMSDMKALAPADDYGLVLWSHADGWVGAPAGGEDRYRSFGDDRGYHINITTLAQTLGDEHFSFIYFDCCEMGNVETLWEMRRLAPVMVASPTMLSIDGMPYQENVPLMFAPEPDMRGCADNTAQFFVQGRGRYPDGIQIAVYDMTAIDALAAASKEMYSLIASYDLWAKAIQQYNTSSASSCRFFDMDSHMEFIAGKWQAPAPAQDGPGEEVTDPDHARQVLQQWREALDKFVTYKYTTRYGIDDLYINRYCGLGCMVLGSDTDITNRGYSSLAWWKDIVSQTPFFSAKDFTPAD